MPSLKVITNASDTIANAMAYVEGVQYHSLLLLPHGGNNSCGKVGLLLGYLPNEYQLLAQSHYLYLLE